MGRDKLFSHSGVSVVCGEVSVVHCQRRYPERPKLCHPRP